MNSVKYFSIAIFAIFLVGLVGALPTVTLSATDANASEPGSDTGTYTVSRTGATNKDLTVFYSISGTATNGTDYNTLGTSVVIPKNSSSATISLVVLDDSNYEGTEMAILTLSSNAAYNIGSPSSGTVNIADNDPAPPTVSVSVIDANASEVQDINGNTDPATYRISRTGSTSGSLTVYIAMGGSATNGTDYTSITSPVTILSGHSFVDVTLQPIDDLDVEGTESASMTIQSDASYSIGTATGWTTIADND